MSTDCPPAFTIPCEAGIVSTTLPRYDEAAQYAHQPPYNPFFDSMDSQSSNPQPSAASLVYLKQPPHVVVNHIALPHSSARLRCPSCTAMVTSKVEHKVTNKTHFWALGLCLLGCWPCCIFPYFVNACRNANHYCPECGAYVGTAFV